MNRKPRQVQVDSGTTPPPLTPGTLTPAYRTPGKLAEAGEGWEPLAESALSDLGGACSGEEDNILGCPFLFKLRLPWIGLQASHCLIVVSLSGTATVLLFVSFVSQELALAFCLPGVCRLSALVIQTTQVAGRGPQNMAREQCELHPICSKGPTHCCQLSGELSLPFFGLSSGVALDRGRVVSPFRDTSYRQGVDQYCQKYLLFVLAENWQDYERIFF